MGFGGQIDYQGPTKVHPGSAIIARNITFNRRRMRMRDGMVDTAFRQTINSSPITGYDVLEVTGDTNPGLYLVAFTEAGNLYIESPSGSGAFIYLATPFTLPANARMVTAQAYNCLYMAFTDGETGLCPVLRYNGLTQVVEPAGTNPVGARWTIGRFAEVGDVVQDANQFWWRCTQAGFMGPEPAWPGQSGYFHGATWVPVTASSTDATSGDVTEWEEWTPAFVNLLPSPVVTGAVANATAGGGIITAAQDVYIVIAYYIAETGEGPWSIPIVAVNTPANASLTVAFLYAQVGAQPGGPTMPRWLAELNLRSDAFFPFTMNVYAAAVATGQPPPTQYYQVQAGASPGEVITLTQNPSTGQAVNIGRPAVVVSPDPAFPGTLAFANPTYANDSSDATFASGVGKSRQIQLHEGGQGDGDPQDFVASASILLSGFTAPPVVTDAFLFLDYEVDGGAGSSSNIVTFNAQYTLDGGTTWININNTQNEGVVRTTFSVALSPSQDYSKILLGIQVIGQEPGENGTSSLGCLAYDVRVGANVAIGEILLQKTASGIDLNGPPTFTGESGLRYGIVLRLDDTSSYSPVDPAAPIPILFTNGEPQRVAILPPGGPSTSQNVLALGVSGNGADGPFFEITETNPPNPASSAITKIVRDGNGNVTATVANAIGFEAGLPIVTYGIGSGLDGLFALASVDPSTNELVWGQDGATVSVSGLGTVAELQAELLTSADAPDNFFALNFTDDYLSDSDDLTPQTTMIPPPQATDISWLPTLSLMCYVDESGTFFLSQQQDPTNILGVGGQLQVETTRGGRGVAIREMTYGQIIALKTNAGYEINTSDVTPANWGPQRLWELHGPPCSQMVALGENFLVFGCKGGAYMLPGGGTLVHITQEIRSDEDESADGDDDTTGSWNEIDWTAALTFWCAVNEDAREVHYGICTDGSGFPNEILRVSYTGGWDFPEARTRTGSLITPDTARKWSRDPIAARFGRYINRTLAAPVACAGDGYAINAHSWAGGVATVQFVGAAPPVGVGDQVQLAIETLIGPNEIPGMLNVSVSAVGSGPATLSFLSATTPWIDGSAHAITPLAASLLTTVADKTAVKGMNTKQMTYALSQPPTLKPYGIQSLSRAAQLVTCIVQAEALTGNTAQVYVEDGGAGGSFDGVWTTASVTNNNDGTWTLTWAQQDVDETSEQGTLYTTASAVRLTAFEPGRLDDNGLGIDAQYLPCYTKDDRGTVLRIGGIRGIAKGTGKLWFHMATEDDSIQLVDQDIDLKPNEKTTIFAREASTGDPLDTAYSSPLFHNAKQAGNGFELIGCTVFGNPWLPGEDE